MFTLSLHSRPTLKNGARGCDFSVITGDEPVPESTLFSLRENLKSVFRPDAGRKEEFSW